MKKNTDVTSVWNLYEVGKDFNRRLDLYNKVRVHNRFYNSDQWRGVVTNGMATFVFNICKRVADYKIASIMSSKVKMIFTPQNATSDPADEQSVELNRVTSLMTKYAENRWEKLKMDTLIREALLDGFNSGDMCAYTYWDDTIDIKQTYGKEYIIDELTGEPQLDEEGNPIIKQVPIMGDFVTELVDGVNVMFGNPNNRKVKGQPYILIVRRSLVSDLKDKAKRHKVAKAEYDNITADNETTETAGDNGQYELEGDADESGKAQSIIKFWMNKNTGTVWMKESTQHCDVIPDTDTKLRCYPIAWTNWGIIKDSYHGMSEMEGMIPNQKEINILFSMIGMHLRKTAFGKTLYDSTRIQSWSNSIGSAIPVSGELTNSVQQLFPGQLNNAVFEFVDKAIEYTLKFLGATDTALGNVNPDNYKALVANQQQAAIPLENIRANLYQFVEDIGLIWLEFMLVKYNVPRKLYYQEDKQTMAQEFNGNDWKDVGFNIKIDVGPSSYWSEITSVATLDNLLQSNRINMVQYLERMPNGYIIDKEKLIAEIKQEMAQQMEQMAMQQQGQEQQAQSQMMAEEEGQTQRFEQMAQFIDSLPEERQAKIKRLPPDEMEKAVLQLMKKSVTQTQ